MIIYFKTLRLFILLFFVQGTICFAQEYSKKSSEKNLWLSTTIGGVGGSEYPGLFGDLSIEVSNESNIYSIQYFGISDGSGLLLFTDFATLESINRDKKSLNGFSILYGKIIRSSFSKVSYSFGLSIIESYQLKRENDLRSESYNYTVGIPLSAQIVFTPIKILAIGIKGYININKENSIIGTSLGLYLGKVK